MWDVIKYVLPFILGLLAGSFLLNAHGTSEEEDQPDAQPIPDEGSSEEEQREEHRCSRIAQYEFEQYTVSGLSLSQYTHDGDCEIDGDISSVTITDYEIIFELVDVADYGWEDIYHYDAQTLVIPLRHTQFYRCNDNTLEVVIPLSGRLISIDLDEEESEQVEEPQPVMIPALT